MKKIILLALLLPLFAFSQPNALKKEKVMKKAYFEKQITDNWDEYSKAFEYADYEKIASYFTFPLTFSLLDNPQIIANKKDLITFYKQMRASVQDGYKYSKLDKSRIIWISKDICALDATYSRFNDSYENIFTGRGIYMYKKIGESWKMFSMSGIKINNKN